MLFFPLYVGLFSEGLYASTQDCVLMFADSSLALHFLIFIILRCFVQELGFDYLRDNLAGSGGQLVMRWYISESYTCNSYIGASLNSLNSMGVCRGSLHNLLVQCSRTGPSHFILLQLMKLIQFSLMKGEILY